MGLRGTVDDLLSRTAPWLKDRLRTNRILNPSGEGLRPGDDHHRAFVGPPGRYDLIGGLTFSLLIELGMRETHRVCDVGCGSLRLGRLLIPYLRAGHYYGIEPNRWLVQSGIRWEVGRSLTRLRKPSFLYRSDFDLRQFNQSFDFIVAQSIFSHTFPDLLETAASGIADTLDGTLVATYVPKATVGDRDHNAEDGRGWVYPECVGYEWDTIVEVFGAQGLEVTEIDWPHPRQKWFTAEAFVGR